MARLPALVSLEDLVARLVTEPASGGEEARAQAALDDASTLVRSVAGETWVDDENELVEDVPDPVQTVVLAAAKRAYLNPEGHAQKSNDDVSVTYARDAASGGVFLTAAERDMVITAVSGTSRPALWTLRTTRGGPGEDIYLPVLGQDEPMPFLPGPAT